MGLCVRSVVESLSIGPGDVVVTNHPAYGGSHLPDVTLITPVFQGGHTKSRGLLGYVASRAHHAEIGGKRPGSMPPDARNLAEEGVVLDPQYLVRGGEPQWARVRQCLETGPFPSRSVEENLADLRAAQAANHRGSETLQRLASIHGAAKVLYFMRALTGQSMNRVRVALEQFGERRYEAEETLDDGSPLRVAIELARGGGLIDFTGSAPVHPGNMNATPAVVRSAVLYVLRLLVPGELPLNEGLLRTVQIRLPEGMLNPRFDVDPARSPAVVGGNVETSQRLVDTLIKALGIAACSQGTMNNVVFGNSRFGYYETVCGGSGAVQGHPGASAVHTHMTNTAITDPELLEHRYPVRLERFAVRSGSGGSGEFRGGDGVTRELLFLEPMSLSILSQHRCVEPFGLEGGGPGRCGEQLLQRADGTTLGLAGVDACEVEPGDRLILSTPGGGGWGRPTGKEDG
jgi:5-oxoprolinase (ATP-hydrolysing)